MRLVDRVVPFTERNPARSKRALYRITDPYLAFWHRFVSPMISAGTIGLTAPQRLWEHQIAPKLDDHMGPVFEAVCRAFVRQPGSLPFEPLRVGEWWDATSLNQIDVVAMGPAGELLLGECKWGRVRSADLRRLQSRADLIVTELVGVRRVLFAVFSRGGVDRQVEAEVEGGRVLHFDVAEVVGE
jgi:AAA+ ATPase superfamily predicted ATPase